MAKPSKALDQHVPFQNAGHVQPVHKQTFEGVGEKDSGRVEKRRRNLNYGIHNTVFSGHNLW